MRIFSMKSVIATLCVAAIAFATTQTAEAGFQVTLFANGSEATVTDDGAGDADGLANSIAVINMTVGGVTFNFSFSETNSPGTPQMASVGSNNTIGRINGTVNAGQTVGVYLSSNGFANPVTGPLPVSATTDLTINTETSNTIDTFMVTSYFDQTNTMSTTATGSVISTVGLSGTSMNTGASETTLIDTLNAEYALNLLLVASNSTGASSRINTTFDADLNIVPTPEPASMALMGLGSLLAGCGVVRRKRKQTAKEMMA